MTDPESTLNYPGIDRLQYFLGNVGMIAAVVFVVVVFGPDSPVMNVVTLLVMVGGMVLDVARLRNTGLSQWFAFIRFVPFGGTVLGIFLFSAQGGWSETQRWDSTGRSILIVELSLLALLIFLMFRSPSSFLVWL
jgi:uncharacterized membrane protein YhaH (DUF805 family)